MERSAMMDVGGDERKRSRLGDIECETAAGEV